MALCQTVKQKWSRFVNSANSEWRDLMVYGCASHALNLVESKPLPRLSRTKLLLCKSIDKIFQRSPASCRASERVWRNIPSTPKQHNWWSVSSRRFKVWLVEFVLLRRLLWPLIMHEISLPTVEALGRYINRYT